MEHLKTSQNTPLRGFWVGLGEGIRGNLPEQGTATPFPTHWFAKKARRDDGSLFYKLLSRIHIKTVMQGCF